MSDTIRTFIAVKLDAANRQTIQQAQDHLKQLDCNIKWVEPENAHLTLKFLGDVQRKKIDGLKGALTNHLQSIKPIKTELTQLGAFPSINSPRILWIGLNDEHGQIAYLVNSLEKALGDIGFKKNTKPFHAHITLGRTRTAKNLVLLAQAVAKHSTAVKMTLTIDYVNLYKSTLTPQGPVYETLERFNMSSLPPAS